MSTVSQFHHATIVSLPFFLSTLSMVFGARRLTIHTAVTMTRMATMAIPPPTIAARFEALTPTTTLVSLWVVVVLIADVGG